MPSRTIRRSARPPRQASDTGVFLAVVALLVTVLAWGPLGPAALALPAFAAVAALAWRQRTSDAPSDSDSSLA
ncbi:hypothetical protein JQC91_13705 [Jannaschia sp. Os4]|uniref:hypothetical protein n=1 Tax=Jannaschia sp. Os4 TaxID=2807617 RepID=UPI00193A3A0A|nr:hypothetical protein [Jannaschia sp. Os4]MBM2577359.1 hypothetical protein [Jannaschia sp. Os4]